MASRERGGVVVLIDALRASATIVTALASDFAAVRPVGRVEQCVRRRTRSSPPASAAAASSRACASATARPRSSTTANTQGRRCVLTTTNAIECLLAAAGPSTEILVGTTINRTAVARAAMESAQRRGVPITLLMAGRNNGTALEDALAAGEIYRAMTGARLHGEAPPSSSALEADFFRSDSGRNLALLGYSDDVRFCAALDRFELVPAYRDGCAAPPGSPMTRVLVTGIGGSIGIDVARSLARDPSIRIFGSDASPWGRRLGERLCHEIVDLPRAPADPPAYLAAIAALVDRQGIDFAFISPDPEIESLVKAGALPAVPHAVPPLDVTDACLDKAKTVARAGLPELFPWTFPLAGADDLEAAFAQRRPPFWLRATIGPGGRGSLPIATPEEGRSWIAYWQRRGRADKWVLQEFLPGRNYNWTGLYRRGTLHVTAAMERLRYFLGDGPVSGVSGQVSLCATVDPARFESVADRVVRALDPAPHGLYSVDLREDAAGDPRVTEINPRLAGRPWLYTQAGVNLALATVRVLLGGDAGDAVAPGGLRPDVHLYRQLDVEPVFNDGALA